MPYRAIQFVKGHYYHIFNRTLNNELLFHNRANYIYLAKLMGRFKRGHEIAVIAYCLMPNHYHLLLRQDSEKPISQFMSVLFNAYVQALNKQAGRKGPLFEGRYHHVWVDKEEYLFHLCRYIHLNPVKAKLVSRVEDWEFSNYLEWMKQEEGCLSEVRFLLGYFSSAEDYRRFVYENHDEEVIGKYVNLPKVRR